MNYCNIWNSVLRNQPVDSTLVFPLVQIHENDIYFQQDGAPPHYASEVREWLDNRFDCRWLGHRGPVEYPARSPDLTPLDFFLWEQ